MELTTLKITKIYKEMQHELDKVVYTFNRALAIDNRYYFKIHYRLEYVKYSTYELTLYFFINGAVMHKQKFKPFNCGIFEEILIRTYLTLDLWKESSYKYKEVLPERNTSSVWYR